MLSAKNVYLVAYNVGCAAGWGYILLSCLKNIAMGTGPQELYNETEQVLQIVQTAALMEVLHALLGIVRSPWVTTLMQVGSRLHVLWGFLWLVPSTQVQLGATLYLFYAFNVVGSSPYLLFYLRYSLFFVLYPTGIAGEVMTMSAALPDLKAAQDSLAISVGPVTISWYLVSIVVLVIYVPGGPFMFMNMVGNRRSAFKKRKAGASKKKAQ